MLRLCTILLATLTLIGACKNDEDPPAPRRNSTPLDYTEVTPGSERDIRPVEAASYARTLEAQLDLVPPDADVVLAIRDLRPLIAQARRVEQVLAGPLARAIPALAKIGGGSGDARLAQLARARELLGLAIAGLEGSGIVLEQGLVVVQGQGDPLIMFAAPDLQKLGVLASLAGAEVDLASSCGELGEQPGWFVCSLGPASTSRDSLARYRPAKQGAALVERLGARLGGVELERVNVAISLAEADGSLDAVLRTDPGLWELSMPVPLPAGQELLAVGPAPALRALVPGTSFTWARVDPSLLAGGEAQTGPLKPELLTGEFWLGAIDDPDGVVAQAGITDASELAKSIQALAALLPGEPITTEQLEGVSVELDRASIELDGKLVPSIGMTLTGPGAKAWAETLGVDPRARLWAYGEYSSLAVGEVQAIPAALGRLEGSGPPPAAVAALPPTLARSLLASEVGLVMHVVLDHWQAPPSEAELASLLAGVPSERRPDAAGITALFQALAPWSSCALWLRRHEQQWIANVSLVPFAVATGDVTQAEAEAAGEVLDVVLAGGDGQAGYRQLLADHPRSAWAYAYRARSGDAPDHHAAVGMIELGLVVALVVPAFGEYVAKAKTSEAARETQAMLSAALAVRERTGSCESLLGEAGPTPPLSISCHAGDGGRCRPTEGQSARPGEYPRTAWSEDPIWSAIDYRPDREGTGSHRYHYALTTELVQGQCRVRARALGDLDGDGVFSTYEREATIGADGSQSVPAMRVENGEE
ncbi:MAG TPA: hypothetical protein VM869_31780 [Enhygromyxa sp.]|nr:hypothetical protein [Enhygromyxa sp.]